MQYESLKQIILELKEVLYSLESVVEEHNSSHTLNVDYGEVLQYEDTYENYGGTD